MTSTSRACLTFIETRPTHIVSDEKVYPMRDLNSRHGVNKTHALTELS
jgi:hypothetical protein